MLRNTFGTLPGAMLDFQVGFLKCVYQASSNAFPMNVALPRGYLSDRGGNSLVVAIPQLEIDGYAHLHDLTGRVSCAWRVSLTGRVS